MRIEDLAASVTARGIDPMNVGRSSLSYDEKRAYFAGVSSEAWAYCRIVYMGESDVDALRSVYRHVMLHVMDDWKPIGVMPDPKDAERYTAWRRKNRGMIRRMTRIVLIETVNPTISDPNKAKWRAGAFGISVSRWFSEYNWRYRLVSDAIDALDRELRVNVKKSQAD